MYQVEQQVTVTETAGVAAQPPPLFFATLALGFVSDGMPPFLPRIDPAHRIVGSSLILVGLALAAAGHRNFLKAGTCIGTNEPTRTLVTKGVHGRTCNPIYLGYLLVYGGICVATQSPWLLLLMLPLAAVIRYGVVAREDAYLELRFCDRFRNYKARVRRWV